MLTKGGEGPQAVSTVNFGDSSVPRPYINKLGVRSARNAFDKGNRERDRERKMEALRGGGEQGR